MEQIYKYPRTRHLKGSMKQAGDEELCIFRAGDIS